MQETIIRKYIIKKKTKTISYKVKKYGRENANTRFL